MVSCDDDEGKALATISDFSVVTPDTAVQIAYSESSAGKSVQLQWQRAKASDGTAVFYEVQFADKNGSFDNPSMTFTPNNTGYESSVLISQLNLNIIAERCGIRPEQTGDIKWRVFATTGLVDYINPTVRTITVKRQSGFAESPTKLYAFGSALAITDMANSIPLKKVSESEFECFLKLGSGELKFTNSLTGEARIFCNDGKSLIEGDGTQIEGGDKVYHIVLNYTTATINIRAIKEVSLFWGTTKETVPMAYEGNSTWTLKNYLLQSRPGRIKSQLYKFQMIELENDGTEVVSMWGGYSQAASTDNPTTNTAADYWYITSSLATVSSTFFTFKFNLDYEGVNVDIALILQPTLEEYYHTITPSSNG